MLICSRYFISWWWSPKEHRTNGCCRVGCFRFTRGNKVMQLNSPHRCNSHFPCECFDRTLVIQDELKQTLIACPRISDVLCLLWGRTTLWCGILVIPTIRNLLWQGQQHQAPGYHLSSQQIGSQSTRQTDGSSSCWGPGWSEAAAGCLHDCRAEKWGGGLVIKERGGTRLIHLPFQRSAVEVLQTAQISY